jgi:hypothetical protein
MPKINKEKKKKKKDASSKLPPAPTHLKEAIIVRALND